MLPTSSMKSEYRFFRIPVDTAESLIGSLIEFPFSIARGTEHYWLRYPADNELCRNAAISIPAEHFILQGENFLIRNGAEIASEQLPQLTWSALKDFVQLRLPRAILAGRIHAKQIANWELKRGGKEQLADAALYDAESLSQWIKSAAGSRLSTLRFCTARHAGHVNSPLIFVIGKPLPPISCQFLCKQGRVFIPLGYHWEPQLDSSLVEQSFGLQQNQWLLWTIDFGCSLLVENQFTPLSRASLRATIKDILANQ